MNIENSKSDNVENREYLTQIERAMLNQERLLKDISKDLFVTRQFIDTQNLHSIALEDGSLSVTSNISRLVNKTLGLKTSRLRHGGSVTTGAAEIGLANIEVLLRDIAKNENSTPHLFGINKGGAFLANYLAHRIGLHQKYLVKCDYRAEFDKIIMCEERDISGPVVIIDDVTRSGKTLKKVKKHLEEAYPNSNVFSIVLVMVDSDMEAHRQVSSLVDYAPLITKYPSVSLPWSRRPNMREIDSEEYFNDIEMDQIIDSLKLNYQT